MCSGSEGDVSIPNGESTRALFRLVQHLQQNTRLAPNDDSTTGHQQALKLVEATLNELELAIPPDVPTPVVTRLDDQGLELLKCVPKYSASVDQSFACWVDKVEGFLNTFNLSPTAIESHLCRLLYGRARQEYFKLQTQLKDSKGIKFPSWKEVQGCLAPLDDPIRRSVYIHDKIQQLSQLKLKLNDSNISRFAKLEYQLDPAPLGDRLCLLFTVFPQIKDQVLAGIEKNTTMDDVYEIVRQLAPPEVKCEYCGRDGHLAGRCYKRASDNK
jgi:hypothetical protein